jgi:uncharacterized protein (TIGR02466 family)
MKSEIFVDKWFATPIWETQLNLNNAELTSWAYRLKENHPGVQKSNKGGWQCANLDNPPQSFIDLKTTVNEILIDVHKSMGLKLNYKSYITESWLNINPPNSFNTKHLHPRSLFSGVYYTSVPEGDAGQIIFEREPLMLSYLPNYVVDAWNDMTSGTAGYQPKTGKLLIFPSWLLHYVEPNNTASDRVSIAFNTNYDF